MLDGPVVTGERSKSEREDPCRRRCNRGRKHHAWFRPWRSVCVGDRPKPHPQKGTIWAVVNSDGTLARHSKDITGAVRLTTGQYRVFARGNVRNCAYEATAGASGLSAPPRTYADVAQGFFDTRSAFVETYDSTGTGTRADSDFYLAILC
jgi:hypothetical protein